MTKLDAGLMTSLPASDSGSTAVWGSKRINPRPQSRLCLTWSGYPSNDDDNISHQKSRKATAATAAVHSDGYWVRRMRQLPRAPLNFRGSS